MAKRGPGRATTHRPSREEQKARENTDLKRENGQLKRQLAQLRRRVGKLEDQVEPEDPHAVPERAAEAPEPSGPVCAECGGQDLVRLDTPSGRTILACRKCRWRND